MKIRNIFKKLTLTAVFTISFQMNAAYERHISGMQCHPGEINYIDPTSNYAQDSAQFITDIMLATEQLKLAIEEGSARQTGAFSKETGELIQSLMKMEETVLQQKMQQNRVIRKQEMNYEANMAEEQVRQSRAVLFKDDTKEEMKLIVKTLEANSDEKVIDLILYLSEKYDKGGEKIPVPVKAAEGACSEEEVENGYCSIKKEITPGKKLAKFFKACNTQKKELVRKEQEHLSQKAAIVANSKKLNDVVNTIDATAKQEESIENQEKTSCTPEDYKNNICMVGSSKEDFQEKVALNHIIPNGSISADNLLTPSFYGGADLRKYDSATIAQLKDKALSKDEVQDDPNQSAVPIVNTYKNSTQYITATQFVDNITGVYLVSNQSANKRKEGHNAEFQALYNKRMAALSLVRAAFTSAIKRRTGTVISEKIEQGVDLNSLEEPIKESVLGAGSYDGLLERVDQLLSSVAVKADAGIGESASMDEINNGSENAIRKVQLDTLKLQNEILFKSLMEDELIELLKAAQISTLVNSPEMIRYLNSLR